MGCETMGDESFTMKSLLKFLGVSRGALRYYEQLGIVRPERGERSNYRTYSIGDIYRVVECLMFRNAGYAVGDAYSLADGTESSEELVERLVRENERRLSWHEAMRDALEGLRDLCHSCERLPEPHLELVEPWRAYYDRGETGYGNFDPDDATAALLRGMPISSFGSVFLGDYLVHDCLPYKSFRAVPARFSHLFPELDSSGIEFEMFGGCPCVVVATRLSFKEVPLSRSVCILQNEISKFMNEQGFEPVYPTFSVGCYPARDSILSRICTPVIPKNTHARRAVRRLNAAHGGLL